ncbi:Protein of unknown function [Loktanella atrilutea]|uniref:DUF3306 domain-containing protein n=1 Tax=Loktanella atrilutea TaxID=366533 RepID=A0A1M4TH29_LOKAT|nr:DUF3306 domain-containing protein [Loktanella atrilutea]SHE43705.1 Protein of unknown function [Loktanella atrilutea]
MTDRPSFFARRRAGLIAERAAEEAPVAPSEEAVDSPEQVPEELSDAELLDALDLPDPDTLQREDDFAAFMARAVPQHLRNRALRSLWRSDPVLANLDGLNDYDADYTVPATGQEMLRSAYRVGRGLLSDPVTVPEAPAAPEPDPVTDPTPAALAEAPTVEDPAPLADPAATDPPPVPEDDTPPFPRRMRFQFGDST